MDLKGNAKLMQSTRNIRFAAMTLKDENGDLARRDKMVERLVEEKKTLELNNDALLKVVEANIKRKVNEYATQKERHRLSAVYEPSYDLNPLKSPHKSSEGSVDFAEEPIPVKILITGYNIVDDVCHYAITSTIKLATGGGKKYFTSKISKRYNDFRQLDSDLQQIYRTLPRLPKTFFNFGSRSLNPNFLKRRMEYLREYLKNLI